MCHLGGTWPVALPLPPRFCLDPSDPQVLLGASFTKRSDEARLAGTAFALERTGKGVSITVAIQPLTPSIRIGGTPMFRKTLSFGGLLLLAGATVLVASGSSQAQHGGGGHGGGGHGGGFHAGGGHAGGFHAGGM